MFFANDHEPIHVHIVKDNNEAKYNVNPIELVYNKGFKAREIRLIETIIEDNVDVITERWTEFFKDKNK